jgi:hypothetical protein
MNKHSSRTSYTLFPTSYSGSIAPEAPYPITEPTPSGEAPPKHFVGLSRRPSYDSSDRSNMEALFITPAPELATVPFMSARGVADRNEERRRILASWHSAPSHPSGQRRGRRTMGRHGNRS